MKGKIYVIEVRFKKRKDAIQCMKDLLREHEIISSMRKNRLR